MHQTTLRRLGPLDFGERDSQGGSGLCQIKKVDCALASIARGRAARVVCSPLGLSRSHVSAKKHRSSDWVDRRRSPARADDTQVKQAIADVVHKRATYVYRRVWERLKLHGAM